ncbi:MAG: hypothetical protein M3542_11110 [Acidobacteriota bacterium]|nr:hypothetical protein [Acidobacteriota bacterium]MDQ5870596.1 hypothetical protein [Acidobacteriota bacterium]
MSNSESPGARQFPRVGKNWVQLLAAVLLFLLVSGVAWSLAPSSRALIPVTLLSLVPLGIVIAVFVRMLRRTDELARRIASEALVLSVVATIAAMIVYPFLETAGFPALRPDIVIFLLAGLFSVGVAIFSRRYA